MQTLPIVSARERICLSCREKTCCSYYTVTVTAQDLLRIARVLQLTPSDFITYHTVPEGEKGGFLLHPDGSWYALSLVRRALSDETASPCIFLIRTNDQHGLCSLGGLRPAQCRAFPTYLSDGFVVLAHSPAGCVRTWSYGDMDLEKEREELIRFKTEETAHNALVEEWNIRVWSDGRERSCEEFCTFLINRVKEQEGSI